jgi:hypothetical protein
MTKLKNKKSTQNSNTYVDFAYFLLGFSCVFFVGGGKILGGVERV